jgi:hypothetical protein
MTFQSRTQLYLYFLFLNVSIFNVNLHAQNVSIKQDPKFEQLLNEKRKINAVLNINESYKIQVFTGNSENAKKSLNLFRQEFADIDATIVFNTPNYKVWVGGFRTRIGAEKALSEIGTRFKNVILIKPNK